MKNSFNFKVFAKSHETHKVNYYYDVHGSIIYSIVPSELSSNNRI
jgi:hypothetical protein